MSKTVTLWVALVITCLGLSGCASLDRSLLVKNPNPVTTEVVHTNKVFKPILLTNNLGQVTPSVAEVLVISTNQVPQEVGDGATYFVSPLALSVAQATGALPHPLAPLAGSAITAALAYYAAFRNRQKVAEQLVSNIEDIREVVRNTSGEQVDKQIVQHLTTSQASTGTLPAIAKIVRSTTGRKRISISPEERKKEV